MAFAHNSNRTGGAGNGSSKHDNDGPRGIVPPSRRYVFFLFNCSENTSKTVPQTRTATATTTIASCQLHTHHLPTQTQTVAAADTVTARNSSRAGGGGSSTADGGLAGNAPQPIGILSNCYDSIAKTTTIARCSFPTNT